VRRSRGWSSRATFASESGGSTTRCSRAARSSAGSRRSSTRSSPPREAVSSSGTQAANAGAAGASPLNEPCPGVRPGGVSRKDKSSRRSDAQSASTRSRASPFRSAPIHRYTATLESVSRTRYVFAGSERRYRERYTEPLGPRATSPPRPSASALLAFSDRRGYSLPSHAHRVAECGKCDRTKTSLAALDGMPVDSSRLTDRLRGRRARPRQDCAFAQSRPQPVR
jgi:hypothetical protein